MGDAEFSRSIELAQFTLAASSDATDATTTNLFMPIHQPQGPYRGRSHELWPDSGSIRAVIRN